MAQVATPVVLTTEGLGCAYHTPEGTLSVLQVGLKMGGRGAGFRGARFGGSSLASTLSHPTHT